MWADVKKWISGNKILAIIIAGVSLVVISSVADGVSMRQTARGYLNLAKGWAAAYSRDTAASKKVYENKISALTLERNSYREKWKDALNKMNQPWTPPSNAKDMQSRFRKMGYRGNLR